MKPRPALNSLPPVPPASTPMHLGCRSVPPACAAQACPPAYTAVSPGVARGCLPRVITGGCQAPSREEGVGGPWDPLLSSQTQPDAGNSSLTALVSRSLGTLEDTGGEGPGEGTAMEGHHPHWVQTSCGCFKVTHTQLARLMDSLLPTVTLLKPHIDLSAGPGWECPVSQGNFSKLCP